MIRYSGLRAVEVRIGGDRRRYQEFVTRDGYKTRIEYPSGSEFAGQIIVENRKERKHYYPDTNEIKVEPARLDDAWDGIAHMLRGGYSVRVESGPTIAQIRTQAATFRDRQGNVSQTLWIDPNTGMILRRDLFDAVGNRIGHYEFSRVNFRPVISPADFEIQRRGAKVKNVEQELNRIARQLGFALYRIPAGRGYELQAARTLGVGNRQILAQFYLGAEGKVSLFQARFPLQADRIERMQAGRLQSYGWRAEGFSLLLVGDLPEEKLARIAQSVGR